MKNQASFHPAVTLALALALVASAGSARGASGDLDPTFSGDGKVVLPVGPAAQPDEARAVVLQPDGKIVAAGYTSDPPRNMAVVRFETNGTPDGTFGSGGTAKILIGSRAEGFAVALASSSRIVVAGFAVVGGVDRFAVARFLSDGTPDPMFGSGGATSVAFGTRDARALAVAVQPDGKIVLGGWTRPGSNRDLALVRLNEDGSPDGTFGTGGQVTQAIGTGNDEIAAILLQGDGKILVTGLTVDGAQQDMLVARFTSLGVLDAMFNGTGAAKVDFAGADDRGQAIAFHLGDGLLVAGTADVAGSSQIAAARLEDDGSLDTGFGTAGKVTTAIGDLARGNAVVVDPSGRFAIAGTARASGEFGFALAQYRSGGGPALTFGMGGAVRIPLGNGADEAFGLALQGDGALVAAGTAFTGSNRDFGLIRLLVDQCGNGMLDPGEQCDPDELGGASCCTSACTIAALGATCRTARGPCDVAEECDGVGTTCPDDDVAAEGTACRLSAGPCDVADECDGISDSCSADIRASTSTVCRPSAGACDPSESCNGVAAACPPDQRLANGTVCRAASDLCDVAERCDGIAASCPMDALASAGATCRAALSACDVTETCDGMSDACPADEVQPTTVVCRVASGVCDVAESCDGTSGLCPADAFAPSDTICRAAAGGCDAPEACTGESAACPGDVFEPEGTVCRPKADPCDKKEECNGISASCRSDRRQRDRDGDATCDRLDLCPLVADPDQLDADDDGLGDACDPCSSDRALLPALIEIGGYATPAGDDAFRLQGELTFLESPVLSPETTGLRIRIEDGNGAQLFDLAIPPGARDPVTRTGWTTNDTSTTHSFRTTTPIGGVVSQVKVFLPPLRPGVVKVTATGGGGSFAVPPVVLPLVAIVSLDPTADVVELCGTGRFPGPEPDPLCAFDEPLNVLTCD